MGFLVIAFFSWYFVAFTVMMSIISTYKHSEGWSAIWTILAVGSVAGIFGIELATLGYVILLWIPIGIAWSIWRFEKHVKNIWDEVELDEHIDSYTLNRSKSRMLPSNNISTITGWIIAWPISIVVNALGDIYDIVHALIFRYSIGIYNSISKSYIDKIDEMENKENKKTDKSINNHDSFNASR